MSQKSLHPHLPATVTVRQDGVRVCESPHTYTTSSCSSSSLALLPLPFGSGGDGEPPEISESPPEISEPEGTFSGEAVGFKRGRAVAPVEVEEEEEEEEEEGERQASARSCAIQQ